MNELDEELGMNHICYLNSQSNEHLKIIDGDKTMIISASNKIMVPIGNVFVGDNIYFINDDNSVIFLKARVKSVFNNLSTSKKESNQMIDKFQNKLQLTKKQHRRCIRKRFFVLIEIDEVEEIQPIQYLKIGCFNKNKWVILGNLETLTSKEKSLNLNYVIE